MTRIVPTISKSHSLGGTHDLYQFENGYGASVVRGDFSYGGSEGFFELAVLKGGRLCYSTPIQDLGITDDVIGWLTDRKVQNLLRKIAALPKAES
jgi:hypothetical protein